MIGTTQKPFEEILDALEGFKKIAVVGCDGCAKVCMTGFCGPYGHHCFR